MERAAAERRDRIVTDERVDAEAALEVAARPDALDDDRPGEEAVEAAGVDDDGAAGVADLDAVSIRDTQPNGIVGVDQHSGPFFARARAGRLGERAC